MTPDDHDDTWERYYSATEDRETRPLFRNVMAPFDQVADRSPASRAAIDLGCGGGTETLALLETGWQVLAIDRQPSAIHRLLKRTSTGQKMRLQTQNSAFENAKPPAADLRYAGMSLPFCPPGSFPAVWDKIIRSLRPKGFFAGHFFGNRDEWVAEPDITFLTREEIPALLKQSEIKDLHEVEAFSKTATQGPKHWHIFEVIARRNARQPE